MSNFSRSAVVLGSCAAALVAAASPAAAAWTPPQELPGTAGRYPLFAAYGAGGAASVGVFGPLALVPSSPQAPLAIAAVGAAPASLPDGLGAPVAVSPGATMLAVGGPRSPLDYFGRESASARLRAAIGPVGGRLRRIPTRGIAGTSTLAAAVDDRGDAAVVFSRCVNTSCATRSVLATFRRRGRGFTTPVVLAKRTGYPVAAVALNAHGDAIVAWIQHRAHGRGNDVRVRTRRADGTLTKVRLAGPTQPVPTIAVTLTPGRHGTVSWFSEAVGEGSLGGPLTVSESDVDARGRIGARNVLDSGTPSGHGEADAVRGARLRATLGADGVTTVAWTGFVGGHYVVRAERLHRDVGQVETLSPATVDAQLMDLASDSAGDTLAVWASVPGATTAPAVAAVIRPAGATIFGPPQLVLTGADASGTAAGAIAPDGRALVAGGPEQVLNRSNPPGVRVTQLLG
ncbi:MAG: hypothetical protein QOD69_1236 [Solirubrobacteraceae bacterium]|nr:hypothetical protein [Solirubrobacteraceae bacterium]